MARGINAAMWTISGVLAVSLLAGIGFYSVAGVSYAQPGDDTSRIISTLTDPQGSAASGSGVVESFTVGALDGLQVFWIAISDTEEMVLLFIPYRPIASVIGTVGQIAMGLVFIQVMRGVVFE